MKGIFTGIAVFILVLFLSLGLTWLFMGNDFFLYKYFAPKMEQARRETFEQSKAYNQGMVQELENMYLEYKKTTDKDVKDAMGSVILHRVADYDESRLPSYLRNFIDQLRNPSELEVTP